ncbi:MAG TPA: hypothetical protein VMU73_07355 [Gaiellaceae bacterium]|nr:hypothetical protein [Gaiellaceae bacterium]
MPIQIAARRVTSSGDQFDQVMKVTDDGAVSVASRLTAGFHDSFEGVAGAAGWRRHHDRAAPVLMRVGVPGELNSHALLDKSDLGAPILVFREAEAEQAEADEIPRSPPVRPDLTVRTARDVRDNRGLIAALARNEDLDVGERPRRGDAERSPASTAVRVEARVRPIKVQQILSLGVENERASVRGVRAEKLTASFGLEQQVEQKGRVRRLGGDTGDAADVDVATLLPGHERPVCVHRLAGLVEPNGQTLLHLIGKQRSVTGRAGRTTDDGPRRRRDPQLRDRPEHLYNNAADALAGLRLFKRDPRGISRPLRTFEVPALLNDDAVMAHGAAVRKLIRQADQVIELHDGVVAEAYDEAVGCSRNRPVDQTHDGRIG